MSTAHSRLESLIRGSSLGPLAPWLLVTWNAVKAVLHGQAQPAWLAGAGLVLFIAGYVAALRARQRPGRAIGLLVPLAALTVAMVLGFGPVMTPLFTLLSIVCGAVVPWTVYPQLPVLVVLGNGFAAAGCAALNGQVSGVAWQDFYTAVLAGVVTAVVIRLTTVIAELRETRQELARSAVAEERLRFARDLHDLLGHTLSVMVVKAQVVKKIATLDPEQAAAQAADIEAVGREALTEVRQTVTGYRGRGLTAELPAARTALSDAGIIALIAVDGAGLPPETDALLGWVVREGVTNVIKHSGATRCEIALSRSDGVTLEILDDGNGKPATQLPSGGHGLQGLTERVAAAGGKLTCGPRRGGGYRLAVRLPALAAWGEPA